MGGLPAMRLAMGQIAVLVAAIIFLGTAGEVCAQTRAVGGGDAVALNNRGMDLYQKGNLRKRLHSFARRSI